MRNGYILSKGRVAGETYTVIVTGVTRPSDNVKTGNMLQIWILLDRLSPVDGVQSGLDASTICRGCPFASGKGCYVNVGQAPLGVWRANKRGAYPELAPRDYASVFAGRSVRFGAYGNPTLIPLAIVRAIASVSAGWTGYFHDWRTNRYAKQYSRYFMASTETSDSYRLAQSLGYRTFHASPVQPAGTRECLSDARGLTCEQCKLCAGLSKGQQSGVWIATHGNKARLAGEIAMRA
jgi:hypothetical protein